MGGKSAARAGPIAPKRKPKPELNACLLPLSTVSSADVEALLDRAFGADRHHRTAYRIRAGIEPIAELSFAATQPDGSLAASIQCWPVELRHTGGAIPMIMVGPVAVDPRWQQSGLGKELMRRMLEVADTGGIAGTDALMLIGDREYYERFFGFSPVDTSGWSLPGPVDPNRLLARGSGVPAITGQVGPRFVRSHLPLGIGLA